MNAPKRTEIETRYLAAYARAMAELERIKNAIHDLPAPDTEGLKWGHVADMARFAEELRDVVNED